MRHAFVALILTFGTIAAHAQTVTYFRADGVLWGIAAGPDGNLWFPTTVGITKMMPTGETTTYPTPRPISGRAMITAAPDGRMWFTEPDQGRIGAIAMDGTITELALPNGMMPLGIAAGSDGAIWFGAAAGTIGSFSNGTLSFTPLPNDAQLLDMAADTDRSVWFVEYPNDALGRVQPPAAIIGFDRPYTSVRTNPPSCCHPTSITRGSDGAMWFASSDGDSIGRHSAGVVTVFTPSATAIRTVAKGPDAGIWFGTAASMGHPAQIGSIATDGSAGKLVALAPEVSRVMELASGSDGNVWATLSSTSFAIARVNVDAKPHHRPAHPR